MKKSLKKLALLSMSAMTLGAVAVNTVALAEESGVSTEETSTEAETSQASTEASSVSQEASSEVASAESASESASEEASAVEESAEAAQESAAIPAVATEEEASALQKAVKTSVETFRQTYADVPVTHVSVEQLDGLDQAVQNAETAVSEIAEGEEVDTSVNDDVFKITVEGRDATTAYSVTYHSDTQEVLESETEELDADDQAEVIEELEFDNLLSFDKVTAIAIETAGYGQAIEWDLERDVDSEHGDKTTVDIEVVEDIANPDNGRKAEITIDAVTGEVLKTEGEVTQPVQPAAPATPATTEQSASEESASQSSEASSASEESKSEESATSEVKSEAKEESSVAESEVESASSESASN